MSMTHSLFGAPRPQQSRGFSLVEVLVAVLVLAIGLIGIAAMQTVGIRYNHSASLRYQATLLSYDILDRMRANARYARTTTGYAIGLGEGATANACESSTTAASPTTASVCTEAQIASTDLAKWKAALAANLPKGDGAIVIQDTPGGLIFAITVNWDDSRGKESAQELVMRSML